MPLTRLRVFFIIIGLVVVGGIALLLILPHATDVVSVTKKAVQERAQIEGLEIDEIVVAHATYFDLTPEEIARGVKERAEIKVTFACRCGDSPGWRNCWETYAVEKLNGEWTLKSFYGRGTSFSYWVDCTRLSSATPLVNP